VSWTERDAILYALAVGAAPDDLALVYERDLKVLPSYGLALARWAVDAAGQLGAYDPARAVHVAQELSIKETLPPAGRIETAATVHAVWDKGKAAIIEVSVSASAFDTTYSIYVPGGGGWGGPRGPSVRTSRPAVSPLTRRMTTAPNQAALYRLTGDLHPLHIDPELARDMGFARPILHGLCTLAAVTLQVAGSLRTRPTLIRSLTARFTAPVYPGTSLQVLAWPNAAAPERFTFAANSDTTEVVSGEIELEKPPTC
jgi:acyl dehydratase